MLAILLSAGCNIQHPINNRIEGRVYGEDFERTFPYKSIPVPLAGAYIQIIPSNKTGYLTDSLGYFKIENLTKKKYHLRVSFVGWESRDTTIVLRVHSTDSLNILLPFSYNQGSPFSPTGSKRDPIRTFPLVWHNGNNSIRSIYNSCFLEKIQGQFCCL